MPPIYPLNFYVYQLVDPRSGRPFYVGKGMGDRAWQHERLALSGRGSNAAKNELIREISAAGLSPVVIVVQEYDLEADAFEHEIELISSTDGILNVRKGGEGYTLDPVTIRRRVRARATRLHALKKASGRLGLKTVNMKREKQFAPLAKNERQKAEIAAWLASLSNRRAALRSRHS